MRISPRHAFCPSLGTQGGGCEAEGLLVRQGLVASALLEALRSGHVARDLRAAPDGHHSRLQQHMPHAVAGDVQQ